MVGLLPPERAAALTGGPVTIDLDATDVEVYDRKKRGVAYNHQGQRVGRPHVATWAEAEIVLAADLGDGTDDPRATAPDLLRRALASLPERARASGRVALRADAGYFAGALARVAHEARIGFAIGAKRIAPPGRLAARPARAVGRPPGHRGRDGGGAARRHRAGVAPPAPRRCGRPGHPVGPGGAGGQGHARHPARAAPRRPGPAGPPRPPPDPAAPARP